MNYGMAILHQPLDYVLKMPVPFTLESYKNFMGTVSHLLGTNTKPTPTTGKEPDKMQMIMRGKAPPEAWFKKKDSDQF